MNTNLKRAEILKFLCLGLSYAFSYAYVCLIDSIQTVVQTTIFVSCLSVAAIIWLEMTMAQKRFLGSFETTSFQKIEVRFWEAILLLLCLNTYFGQIPALTLLFIHAVVVYMVLVGTGHMLSDRSSVFLPFDLVNGFCRLPFINFFARILSVHDTVKARKENAVGKSSGDPDPQSSSEEKEPVHVIAIIVVLLFILVIFGIALNNLALADARFSEALFSIDSFLSNISVSEITIKIFFSIPVGAYLFGLFQGCVRSSSSKEKEYSELLIDNSQKLHIMPDYLFCGVLSVFLLVYLIFFISQGEYMFSAFAGRLPEEFTASEYAVSGFHELINVVLINFLLLSLVRLFGKHKKKLLNILSIALMAESMVFSTISASKIILYMTRFGYTSSRTMGLWGTAVVFCGSLLAIVHLAYKKRTFAPWLMFSAGSYVLMNFICFPFI